ncbi:hypothetical protein Ngar_c07820 [Candidatus Nitrososphaera gargensis Ga9.2]|uniref:Uncharacterized protein n=1 Tax=Nitrososphaera gargensis (strain Ga9.2) TaxID=1237085 RepID=K0IMB3_NITGG|nr:hypothetical protein Ngar_c07820 [Candidatus Nitrososphaera gargensis Ga9.2]
MSKKEFSCEEPVSAERLKIAFDKSLSILGQSSKEALLHDLQNKGIDLDGTNPYSFKQIEQALENILGEDATELLIQRWWKALEE